MSSLTTRFDAICERILRAAEHSGRPAGDVRLVAVSKLHGADMVAELARYWAGAGTVVAALMDYYGMPLWLTNLIAGFTSTLPVLQMAGSGMYQRTTHPARMTRGLSVAWRAMLPVCFFSVLLPMPLGAAVAPLAYLTALVLNQLVVPAMNDWMVNSLNRKISSDYYALRETAFMVMVSSRRLM